MFTFFKNKPLFIFIALIGLFALTISSCEKADSNNDNPPKDGSRLQIYLTDAPTDYAGVWIDIQKVMVRVEGISENDGWSELNVIQPGKYNLLEFQNGKDTLLASSDIPSGKLTDILFTLGENNYIEFTNGDTEELLIPGSMTSSQNEIHLVVENEMPLEPNETLPLVLDFNLEKSLQEPSKPDSGNFYLMPDIRIFAKGAEASVEGWVYPAAANARVVATTPFNDTLTAIPDRGQEAQFFKLWGIPEGNYTLKVVADPESGYKDSTLDAIQIVKGQVFKTDTIKLVKE